MGQIGVPISFGRQLAALIEAHNFTLAQLSEQTNVPLAIIDALVNEQQILTADVAFSLSLGLALSPLALLELQRSSYLRARTQVSERLPQVA